jgi:hypothetical protein
MKKLITIATLLIGLPLLSACGNQTFLDTTYTFNYAQFILPNGEIIQGKLIKWRDYDDGEQLQLVMEDGNTYLVSSFNAVLSVSEIKEGAK